MSELADIHDAMPEGIAKEAVCILTNISQRSTRDWPVSPEQFAAQKVEVAKRIVELKVELVKANTFIELLKGMVEQLENGEVKEYGRYDLQDLMRRMEGKALKSVEVKGTVTEGREFVEAAMAEGVKFVISSTEESQPPERGDVPAALFRRGDVVVTLLSVGKGKTPS